MLCSKIALLKWNVITLGQHEPEWTLNALAYKCHLMTSRWSLNFDNNATLSNTVFITRHTSSTIRKLHRIFLWKANKHGIFRKGQHINICGWTTDHTLAQRTIRYEEFTAAAFVTLTQTATTSQQITTILAFNFLCHILSCCKNLLKVLYATERSTPFWQWNWNK